MTTITGEDRVSGRGVTGDGIVMHERPALPIVRNTVLLSATQAVCCAVGLPRRSWQPKQASA
jgi:hypothetical protein